MTHLYTSPSKAPIYTTWVLSCSGFTPIVSGIYRIYNELLFLFIPWMPKFASCTLEKLASTICAKFAKEVETTLTWAPLSINA